MDKFAPSSASTPHSETPNTNAGSRFTSQTSTAEDLLKEQTVGLVHLSDFRKRRAEAIEAKERASQDGTPVGSGATTPRDGASTPQPSLKKKRKTVAKAKVSFGVDEEDEVDNSAVPFSNASPRSSTPAVRSVNDDEGPVSDGGMKRKKVASGIKFTPKAKTKAALLREAQEKEQLRRDFAAMRDAVRSTEFVIPFVFYDGTNIPGGTCRVKKGDHIWLFLDKARKVGAETGVGGGDKSRKEWARISVDDLMLVRGEVIIPHHYEFYYFMANKSIGFNGLVFDHSAQPTTATPVATEPDPIDPATYDPLAKPEKQNKTPAIPDSELEGFKDDALATRVVDRRWYERNKHIFPASVWEEFDPTRDYSKTQRKDTEGNSFFFS